MEFDLRAHTVLLTIAGSRAYGTSSATSDVDVKGVAIPPAPYYLGYLKKFEQADSPANLTVFLDTLSPELRAVVDGSKLEGSVYELTKFVGLAADCNPNILDALFCREDAVLLQTAAGRTLRERRDEFISAKAKFTFSGYAFSQIKRIRLHRQWLLSPLTAPPTRAQFGLPERTLIPSDQLAAVNAALSKRLDEWEVSLAEMPLSGRIAIQEGIERFLKEFCQGLPEGLVSEDDRIASAKWLSAARNIGADDNLIYILQKEREYAAAMSHWKSYQTWKTQRNADRAALEAQFGYDCYFHDTEFLTSSGWKKFDDVLPEDQLATVYLGSARHRKWGGVEYQRYTEKFDSVFSGNLYHFTGTHTDTLVTPNHRMLVRPVEKNNDVKHEWVLEEAAHLPNFFEVLRCATPKLRSANVKDLFGDLPIPCRAFLSLVGWFLSDGSIQFYPNGLPKSVNITQVVGGKLAWKMARFQSDHGGRVASSLYRYERGPDATHQNPWEYLTLNVRDQGVVRRIYTECGHAKDKRIPRWVYSLSKELMERLFDGMVGGDGTIRDTNLKTIIYYTSLSTLADDVQELAVLCGWESAKWGPYPAPSPGNPDGVMWHVHVNKNADQTKTMQRSQNVSKVPVSGERIVCFSVPNRTLITRRNGKVSIHGNCKHAMHLVRLFRMGHEILTTGKVHVWRGGDGGAGDADELRAIRAGAWTYDELEAWTAKAEKDLSDLYQSGKYVVPKQPDRKKLDALVVELVEQSLRGNR